MWIGCPDSTENIDKQCFAVLQTFTIQKQDESQQASYQVTTFAANHVFSFTNQSGLEPYTNCARTDAKGTGKQQRLLDCVLSL